MENLQNLRLLSEREAARLTRRAIQTLRNDRYLRRGLPFIKLGRSVRYRLSDILEFLERNKISPEKG